MHIGYDLTITLIVKNDIKILTYKRIEFKKIPILVQKSPNFSKIYITIIEFKL